MSVTGPESNMEGVWWLKTTSFPARESHTIQDRLPIQDRMSNVGWGGWWGSKRMKNTVCHSSTNWKLELWTRDESRPGRAASESLDPPEYMLECKTATSAGCPPEETATGQHTDKEKDVERRACKVTEKPAVLPGATGTVRCLGQWRACEIGFQNACRHQNRKIRTVSFCVTQWCWTDSVTLSHLLFSAGILHHFLYSLDYI